MARIDLDFNNVDLIYDETAKPNIIPELIEYNFWYDKKLISGAGVNHTDKTGKYNTITLADINSMVKTPQSIDKLKSKWFFASTLMSRKAEEQRKDGGFYALIADLDKLQGYQFKTVSKAVRELLPDTHIILYTTASATTDNPKTRIIIPCGVISNGVSYEIYQEILNDKLESLNITPDRKTQSSNQISFLPNKISDFYEYEIIDGYLFNAQFTFKNAYDEKQREIAEEKKAVEQRQDLQKKQHLKATAGGKLNVIHEFNNLNSIESMLDSCGFKQIGSKYLSPLSSSKSAGVKVYGDIAVSHHESDSVIGHKVNGVQCYDTFDLYAYFQHKEQTPNFNHSLRQAGDDINTSEGITLNKHNQRIHMKEQEDQLLREQQDQKQDQKQEEANKLEWEEPEPIEQKLLPVQPLPDEAIPTPFKGYIYDISQRWSVPLDFPFVSTILVASSIIGRGANVRPKQKDNWSVIPNLWGGIVGDPSIMKSPVLNEVINKSIGRLEKTAREKYNKEWEEFEIDNLILKSRREGKEKDIKDTIKKEKDIEIQQSRIKQIKEELQDINKNGITEPKERRYKVNDCTIEKYVELNKDNPRGLLYFRDELIGFFKRLDKVGNEDNRAFILETWNGNASYTQDRVGRGTVKVDNLCMSLIGGIQPDKLITYIKDAISGGNDGFVQRLQMMVYPDKIQYNFVDRYPDTEAKNNFYRIIETLAYMNESDFIEAGAVIPESENDKTPFFKFDNDAYKLFKEWLIKLQSKISNPDEHPIMTEHLSKYRSLMPSLALIYHLIEIADAGYNPDNNEYYKAGDIPEHCTLQAISCVNYLESHARRIYQMAVESADTLAIGLSEKILNKQVSSPFTARDVYRNKWRSLDTPEAVEIAVNKLINLEWLQKEQKTKGKRTFAQYNINPKVFDLN